MKTWIKHEIKHEMKHEIKARVFEKGEEEENSEKEANLKYPWVSYQPTNLPLIVSVAILSKNTPF